MKNCRNLAQVSEDSSIQEAGKESMIKGTARLMELFRITLDVS